MSREIVRLSWCDRCDAEDRKTPATHTYTVGLVHGETRPAPRVLELCDEHDPILADVFDLLAKNSIPLDPNAKAAKPAPSPAAAVTYRGGSRIECDVCGVAMARSSLVNHIWSQHRPGETKPEPPRVCPDCRTPFDPAGMSMHRNKVHGYSAVDEAYAGLVK